MKKIHKVLTIKNLEIIFSFRSKNNFWGRFGGGWNWKFGFQSGGSSVIFSFLVFDLWIRKKRING